MAKTPSSKLFDLVKSLDGPEKRYVRLFASYYHQGRTSKYMTLFEAIDQQEDFDEKQLIAVVYGGKLVESKKFSELKAYLYDLCLKALQSYDEPSSNNLKLLRLRNNVQILFSRSRFSDAIDQLKKAEKLGLRLENFTVLIEIIEWQKKIAFAQGDVRFLEKELEVLENHSQEIRVKMANLIDYQNLFYRIMKIIRLNPLQRGEEKNEELETIMRNDLMKTGQKFISNRAHFLYHRIAGLYHYTKINYQDFYNHSKHLVELFEDYSEIRNEEVSEYISAISNYALSCGLLGKYSEVEETLPKFLKITVKNEADQIKIHHQYYTISFSLCIHTGDFEKGKVLLEKHFKDLKKFPENTFQSNSFYHSYFYIYFGIGDYNQALTYLNEWLNLPRSNERQDMQGIARILNLIVHYEMGNVELLKHLMRSVYRFLQKRNRLLQFETLFLSFIKDSTKLTSKKEMKIGFISLRDEFIKLETSPSEKVIFQYFDFKRTAYQKTRE